MALSRLYSSRHDGQLSSSDTVQVVVSPASNNTTSDQIDQSSDDVNEDGSAYESNSPFVWIGNAGSTSYLGLRFTGMNIPPGATVEETLKLYDPVRPSSR